MAKNIDDYLSGSEHDGVDHTAAPFNLLDEAAHDALDHTGLTGIQSGPSIQVTNNGGATQGPQPTLNVIPSGGVSLSAVDDPGNNRVNLTISAPTSGLIHMATFQTGVTGTSFGSISADSDPGNREYLAIISVNPSNLTSSTQLVMRFGGATTNYTNSVGGATTYVDLGQVQAGVGLVVRVELMSIFVFTDISMSAGNWIKTAVVRRMNTDNTEYLNRAVFTGSPGGGFGTFDLLTTSTLQAAVKWDLYRHAQT